MGDRERLSALWVVLEGRRTLLLESVDAMGRAAILADDANRFRYEKLREAAEEEHKKVLDSMRRIESELAGANPALDEDMVRVEMALKTGLLNQLEALKEVHTEMHSVLEHLLELSRSLSDYKRNQQQSEWLQLEDAWALRCGPRLHSSCSILGRYEHFGYDVVEEYISEVQSGCARIDGIMYEPSPRSRQSLRRLTSQCGGLKSHVLSTMRWADREIVGLVERMGRLLRTEAGAGAL